MIFKLLFGLTPHWIKEVEKNGKDAKALVLSDPKDVLKGVAGYQGRDAWIDVKVEVQPWDEPRFEAKMQSKLSQLGLPYNFVWKKRGAFPLDSRFPTMI